MQFRVCGSDRPWVYTQHTGVTIGEYVYITFDLLDDYVKGVDGDTVARQATTADVIYEIEETGGLRIGLHVRGMGDDEEGSESYVNTGGPGGPDDVVPAPSSVVALLGLAIVAPLLGWRRRRSPAH